MTRAALAILRKDLRIELRTKQSVPAMALFSVTAFVLFHFGLDRDRLDGNLASSG
jgi:heme exporter protein B